MKRLPRIDSALTIGVHFGAGTYAHRVASYNPWIARRRRLDGKTVEPRRPLRSLDLFARLRQTMGFPKQSEPRGLA
jgi:hypothetical protein